MRSPPPPETPPHRRRRGRRPSPAALVAVLLLAAGALAQDGPRRFRFDGSGPNQFQGVGVSDAGDVDADGWPDVIVGASGEATFGSYSGAARIYSGRTGALLRTFFGTQPLDEFGYSVGAAGDLNQDGYADVLVGAIGESQSAPSAGSARVLSGEWMARTALGQPPLTPAVLLTVHGLAAGDNFGLVVAGGADINLDGVPDLVIGAPRADVNGTNSGSITVISGATGSVLATLHGDAAGDQLGHAAAVAGDVNGDGWPDVIGGAFHASTGTYNAGMARIYSGEWIARTAAALPPQTPPVLATFSGAASFDSFGVFVAAAGDVNGDGYADVVVGAPGDDTAGVNAGAVRVFSGEWVTRTALGQVPVTPSILHAFTGDAPGDNLGMTVGGAGDADGDGVPDLVAGAPFNDSFGTSSGCVRIWSGATGAILATFYGTVPLAQFGLHVSSARDVNRDGFADVIIGAPFDNPAGSSSGSAFVCSAAAGQAYGLGLGGWNTMELNWIPGPAGARHAGLVHIGGAAPNDPGLLGISTAPASIAAGSMAVLLDLGPAFFGVAPLAFSLAGERELPVDLKNPLLAGLTFYLQAADVGRSPPQASNGLVLLFAP